MYFKIIEKAAKDFVTDLAKEGFHSDNISVKITGNHNIEVTFKNISSSEAESEFVTKVLKIAEHHEVHNCICFTDFDGDLGEDEQNSVYIQAYYNDGIPAELYSFDEMMEK